MKKKAFTLIELLAVVVILAVVSVVATPIVLDVIKDARKSANMSSANMVLSAANNYYAESLLNKDKKDLLNGKVNLFDELAVENKPKEGQVYINKNGDITLVLIIDDTCYVKSYNSNIEEYDTNSEECIFDPTLDETKPIVNLEILGGKLGNNNWYLESPYVKVTVTDEDSGFESYKWCSGLDCTPNNIELENNTYKTFIDGEFNQICVIGYDKIGNASDKVCSNVIKVDTVVPEINGIADIVVPLKGSVDLLKGVEATDTISGIDGNFTIEPSNVDTSLSGTYPVKYIVYDKAGNKKEVTRNVIVSAEAPTITFTHDENAINSNGWAKEDFYVTINIKDNSGYGIRGYKICTATTDTCDLKDVEEQPGNQATRLIAKEDNNNRICVQATDNTGNSSEVICSDAYKLDKTAPIVGTIKVNGSSEIKDWYNENVTIVAVDGTDSLSGHLSTTVNINSITLNTEGTEVVVTTKDKAGNESTNSYTIKLDKTSPVVTITEPSIDGNNGWYKTKPTITINVTDEVSKLDSYKMCMGINCEPIEETTEKNVIISDTTGTQICVLAYDKAGNMSGKVCSNIIKVDTIAPEISGIEDIVVERGSVVDLATEITVNDTTSGIDGMFTYSPTSVDTSYTKTVPVKYTVYDKAGNKKEVTRNVIVSASAPTITFTPEQGSINSNGWAKEDFYVTVNIADNTGHGVRGYKICTATTDTCDLTAVTEVEGNSTTRLIAIESNNNRICVQATDNTGQTSEVVCSDAYKLDKTAPTVGTIKVNGSSEIKDWYNENVTIETIDGTDSLSGHLSTTVNISSITSNTEGETVTVTTKDKAGNESTNSYTIKLDKTTPSVTITKEETSTKLTATLTPSTTPSNYTYKWYKGTSLISGATSKTYTPTEAGTYKVVVTTGAGKTATSNEITINSYTVSYNLNGGTGSITSTTKIEDINTSITLNTPTKDGYEFLGWGTSSTDTTVDYIKGSSYTANENKTLYAIWKKTVTITFIANGANISSTSVSCDMYNASTTCSITSPVITRDGYTIIGFNTSSSGTTSEWGSNTSKNVSSNATYNAITSKELVANFNKNTVSSISATSSKCTIYNTQTSCQPTLPTITAQTNFTSRNWGTSAGQTSAGVTSITLTASNTGSTWYALNSRELSWNFDKNATSSISKTSDKCTIWSTTGTCSITTPTITAATGYTQQGFGTATSSTSATVSANASMTLSNSTTGGTYYAIQSKTITVSYAANGGSGTTASQTCTMYNSATTCSITLNANNFTRTNYSFSGWSTGTSSVTHNAGTSYNFSSNTTLNAIWKSSAICRRATTLHTETCVTSSYCYSAGYYSDGPKGTSTITYGSKGTSGTLKSGDAFDCDVNGDGVYDAEKERFYYVSDLYTSGNSFDSNYAVLIYYNNTLNGVIGTYNVNYDSSYSYYGPRTAVKHLPKTSQWTKVSLTKTTRQLLSNTGSSSGLSTFSYSGYAARFVTYQEIAKACGGNPATSGELDNCNYLMENTKYSSSSNSTLGYWLETPSSNSSNAWIMMTIFRSLSQYSVTSNYAIRPVIEIKKTDIDY